MGVPSPYVPAWMVKAADNGAATQRTSFGSRPPRYRFLVRPTLLCRPPNIANCCLGFVFDTEIPTCPLLMCLEEPNSNRRERCNFDGTPMFPRLNSASPCAPGRPCPRPSWPFLGAEAPLRVPHLGPRTCRLSRQAAGAQQPQGRLRPEIPLWLTRR
jgi:hypothetical protein